MKDLLKRVLISVLSAACILSAVLGIAVVKNGEITKVSAAPQYTGTAAKIQEQTYEIGLNMVSWALEASSAGSIYVAIDDSAKQIPYGGSGEEENWDVTYNSVGDAVRVNGVAISTYIVKTHAYTNANLAINGVSYAGDEVTVGGWFENKTHGAFCVSEKTFVFDGQMWEEKGTASYDIKLSSTTDANPQNGIYASMTTNDIPVSSENGGWKYNTAPCGSARMLLNGEPIEGILQKFTTSDWYINISSAGKTAVSGDVVTVGGWFYCSADGKTTFIKINPTNFIFDGSKWTQSTPSITVKIEGEEFTDDLEVGPFDDVPEITATSDIGDVSIVYETGAIQDGKFVLRDGESASLYEVTFSVKDANGVVYRKRINLSVGVNFTMENGAAVRASGDSVNGIRFTAELSEAAYGKLEALNAEYGMIIVPRDYITEGYELTLSNLFGENAKFSTEVSAGIGQEKRLMLNIEGLTPCDADGDGKFEIRGAITDILTENLTREFVGVAYAHFNDVYVLASFYANDIENNARSMYYVSQRAIDENDHTEALEKTYIKVYDDFLGDRTYKRTYTVNLIKFKNGRSMVESRTFTGKLNESVTVEAEEIGGYKLTSDAIISSKLYANKDNVFNFYYKDASAPSYESVAWYHPILDSSDGYMNETNKKIAETIAEAGFTTVNLAGSTDPLLNNDDSVEVIKKIINMFYAYGGLKTVVYTHNASTEYYTNSDYISKEQLPDFFKCEEGCGTCGLCEGFTGFLVWDEPMPTAEAMNRLAEYAAWYVNTYGDSQDARFMVNLFPSYSDSFSESGSDYKSYSAYIKAYCDTVLKIIGDAGLTKYLSMDSYPIMKDGTLKENYLYDLAMLKKYAVENEAFAHACLQACGWEEGNDYQSVAPTKEQMRLVLYTALAFGMDSVSWWGYAQPNDGNPILADQVAVQFDGTVNDSVYNALKEVNKELETFGSLYKNYDWKGVIMSSPSKGTNLVFTTINQDPQYKAYDMVKSDSLLSSYILDATDTKSFASVSGSGSNHIIGVMEDGNGNEAFTVVNYSAIKDNMTLALTLKANASADYVVYKGGESTTVTIGTDGYTLNLAPGEAAFIVAATSEHTVTFKDYNGDVLKEYTLELGQMPVFDGAEPTRDGYIFTGWSPEIVKVSGDATYVAQYSRMCEVTFINGDGTETEQTVSVLSGQTVNEPDEPTLDGYKFMGWKLNGSVYDFEEPVPDDITLVAWWSKSVTEGEKSVILTAEQVRDQVVRKDPDYLAVEGVSANETWYYDSDYTDTWVESADKLLQYVVTYSTSAENFTHTITLPKVNYTLYSKVDFGYRADGSISDVVLGGTAVAHDINRTVSIRTDENGTTAYVYTTNNATVVKTIALSEEIATGKEGLTLSFKSNGYMWIKVTQFHGREMFVDYTARMVEAIAKLPANAEDLTYSEEEARATADYLKYAEMRTEYEKSFGIPEIVELAKKRSVTFINADGTANETTITLDVGEAVSNSEDYVVPTLDGYLFKCWLLNGEAYDLSSAVIDNITLVASWGKITANGEKRVVLTAEQVLAQTVSPESFSQTEVQSNDSWWYDTDYPDYGLGGNSLGIENLLAQRAQFLNSNAAGVKYEVSLPKLNYTLYSKVDFALQIDSANGVSDVSVNGVSIEYKINRTFSVVTDENGTRLIIYVPMQPVASNPAITIPLTQEVAMGVDAIKLGFKVSGYSYYRISEYHGTERVIDYAANMASALNKLPASEAELTGSDAEYNAVVEYLTNKGYGTAYERSVADPAIIIAAKAKLGTRTILTGLYTSVTSNATYDQDKAQLVMSDNANNEYTITLPRVNYSIYSRTDLITVFGEANQGNYGFSAYGKTFDNINYQWNWVVVVTAGAEGYTDGSGTNHGEGSFLIIGTTDKGTEWLSCVRLPDSVASGEEGLTFTITTGGNWDWVKFRNSTANEPSMVGQLR